MGPRNQAERHEGLFTLRARQKIYKLGGKKSTEWHGPVFRRIWLPIARF